jgi:hypothetical protein
MSLSWAERKDILTSLLQARGDDDEGIALDRVLHGQNTIGRTCKFSFLRVGKSCDRCSQFIAAKTIKIDSLRFTDNDLIAVGALDRGQFGVVCPITDARVFPLSSDSRLTWSTVFLMDAFMFASQSKGHSLSDPVR